MAYTDQDPTTQVFYRITPIDEDDKTFLHYVFWSFGPSIDGFKYCKPVISIDGTHLYGKYQEKLLVTMTTDANNKVFPLAFAVVNWIPCSHAIRVCNAVNIDSTTYIQPCYSLDYALNTYSHEFVVPKLQSLWRDSMGPKWLPNLALMRGKGQPMKSRIRNEMDGVRNKDREPGWRREDADLIES
ncbi:hypothetical protein SO802_032474 [Lithocarpus litseifolius]|uniref:MULE transposase domain-containing protein n=1 Tax=Lithocarpus litseifolius TaxID=425828 RepID=A0AAW2BDA1_9ROSI